MARKSKVKKVKEQKKRSGLKVGDFQFPGEKSSYFGGLAGIAILFVWIAAGLFFVVKNPAGQTLWYVPVEVMAYPVLAVVICNLLAARPRMAQFKKAGRQSKVMSNNFSDLYRVLVKQSSLLGMKSPPDMYLVNEPTPIIYSLPGGRGTIIASTALQQAVTAEEFEALMAHEVTHIACKHVRMDLAMTFVRSSNFAVKILLFPVLLMGAFARAWSDLIDFTADRGSLLATLHPSVVNAAIVKFAVAADPNAGITREELQAYIDSSGDITTDAAQMERHFKVGQFMSSQPGLRERIEQLSEFPGSEQGKEAIAKAAETLGVSASAVPTYRKASSDVEHVLEDGEDLPQM